MNPGNLRVWFLLVLSFAVLFSVPGWSQESTYAQKLYGDWYTYSGGSSNADSMRHQFRHDKSSSHDELVVTRLCRIESHAIVAKAVSPIEISEDTIRILKSATDVQPIEGASACEVSISAGVFNYSFSEEGHLVLTNPGGNPDYLELARDAKASGRTVPKKIYGTWLLPPFEGKTMRMQVRWVFYTTADRQDKVRQITVCHQGNNSLVSHVDSDLSISDESIKVLQSASHQELEGAFSCEAKIEAATWHYSVAPDGTSVTLSGNGAKPILLTREPQSGLN